MGDNVTDLPAETDAPPVPPKTYRWEDIRRQKIEGGYPWTHLYKPPFDINDWEKMKEHEYEPITPMDVNRKQQPAASPCVKISAEMEEDSATVSKDVSAPNEKETRDEDRHHLRVPKDAAGEYEEDSENEEEITAEQLQHRLEERYFGVSSISSRHEYELPESRSESPTATSVGDNFSTSSSHDAKISSPSKMQLQADKIKQKFKNFKDQLSKDRVGVVGNSSPSVKRKKRGDADDAKKSKPIKKNKFNFRKRNVKQQDQQSEGSKFHLPRGSEFRLPQAPHFSFPSLPTFSRSRSSSVKDKERKRSVSSENDSRTRKRFDFNFGTYPRLFCRKAKSEDRSAVYAEPKFANPKSAPTSPLSSRRSPFTQKWISRFTDSHKKDDGDDKEGRRRAKVKSTETVVQESIFISLHDDTKPPLVANTTNTTKQIERERTIITTAVNTTTTTVTTTTTATITDESHRPTNHQIDSKNFIFISLHEERFPEKLDKPNEERESMRQQETAASEIEEEGKKCETARKFQNMLRRLETNRKLKADRAAAEAEKRSYVDEKPEPVIITEITNDDECENVVHENREDDVEMCCEQTNAAENIRVENNGGGDVIFGNVWKARRRERRQNNIHGGDPTRIKIKISPEKTHEDAANVVEVKIEQVPTTEASEEATQIDERIEEKIPRKIPRKKLRKLDSDKESKESLSAFEEPVFNDAVILDERQPVVKKSISACLQEIELNVQPSIEPEHNARHFKEYAQALESSSRSFSSIEIENNYYSNNNTLARLETPVPPVRPSRMYSLQRARRNVNCKMANRDLDSNFNTFPITKPVVPRRRKCRKHSRPTYSDSTNNTNKSIDQLEDFAINQNIVNSKQLSVSFLPLTSNIVGEPMTSYDIRETSSMVHLNFNDPPVPPKRKKAQGKYGTTDVRYNSLPNRKYDSKTLFSASETYNLTVDADFEYVDDVTNSNNSPPKPPSRKRFTAKHSSNIEDGDRTSRDLESLPSEKSAKDDVDCCDSDSIKDFSGYAVIGKPNEKSHSATKVELRIARTLKKPRRLSEFFTLPRIRRPTNYVLPASYTRSRDRRLPSPSRPPRTKPAKSKETEYTNDERETCKIDFAEEEQLNFNLATDDDDIAESIAKLDSKNLQTEDIFERMKTRPLPAPPRPTRKSKNEYKSNAQLYDYSRCNKIIQNTGDESDGEKNDTEINNLNCETVTERKIINTSPDAIAIVTAREVDTEEQSPPPPPTNPSDGAFFRKDDNCESAKNKLRENVTSRSRHESSLQTITAEKLHVSELNVTKLSISEIESSNLVTSNFESSSLHVTELKRDGGQTAFNATELTLQSSSLPSRTTECRLSQSPHRTECEITYTSETGTQHLPDTPSLEHTQNGSHGNTHSLSRVSSSIPETGSDEDGSTATKVVRPSRRKHLLKKEQVVAPQTSTAASSNRPSVPELVCQILQICHSSVGQAIHSLLEQVMPEDREKRNEVQAAIWVITIIVAGCLMLGLQSNEKVVHHHHWDFHFPPPH